MRPRLLLLLSSFLLAVALSLASGLIPPASLVQAPESRQTPFGAARATAQDLQSAATDATASLAQVASQTLAQDIERVEDVTTQLRQLQPTTRLEIEFLDQQQLREFIIQSFDRDYLPVERESDQKLLVALGLLREDQDIVQEWLELYEDQVLGLYDSDTKKLHVIADTPALGPVERVTLSHEYVHALQDQHFDLNALAPRHSDNNDAILAAHALMEGDATLSMGLYALRELTQKELAEWGQGGSSTRLAQAPLVLREELEFPYTQGLRLVRRLHGRGGFAAVNQAFADPPRSTAQVLHPEKYDRRQAPEPVALPDLSAVAGEGWQVLSSNTLGEFYLRVLIEQYVGPASAQQAASGWAGDRWELLTRGDQTAVVVRTLWDTEVDADEFLASYADSLQARFRDQGQVERSAWLVRSAAPGYAISAQLRGRGVDVVIAPDEDTCARLAQWLAANS